MLGDPTNPGMIPRAMEQIFCSSEELKSQGWTITLRASMLEIHNEEYRDLLGKGLSPGKTHRVPSSPVTQLLAPHLHSLEHGQIEVALFDERGLGAVGILVPVIPVLLAGHP